jgi:elongation factor Ts
MFRRASPLLVRNSRHFASKVSASMVKELRSISGAPMMDCKKALEDPEVVGNIEKALEWLRLKGHASAAKKADREANEGLVGVCIGKKSGALVQISSETDFVARNDLFQQLVSELTATALSSDSTGVIDVEQFLQSTLLGTEDTVSDRVIHVGATVRENIGVHRAARLAVDCGVVTNYVHNAICPGMGTSGAIVALETDSEANQEALQQIGKKLAMHIVAAKPEFLDPASVPEAVVNKEKELLAEEIKESGKPANIIDKIITGRLSKFYTNTCLLEQPHMIEEGNPKVKKVLKASAGELGTDVRVSGFFLYSIK